MKALWKRLVLFLARDEIAQLEFERDEALEEVEELNAQAEIVSSEFEKDCWRAMRSLLDDCKFPWRDFDHEGVTAEVAREHIAETIRHLEAEITRLTTPKEQAA